MGGAFGDEVGADLACDGRIVSFEWQDQYRTALEIGQALLVFRAVTASRNAVAQFE